MPLDTILAHSDEKSTTSILRDTNYTLTVTEAAMGYAFCLYLLRLSPEFSYKPGASGCSHSLHAGLHFRMNLLLSRGLVSTTKPWLGPGMAQDQSMYATWTTLSWLCFSPPSKPELAQSHQELTPEPPSCQWKLPGQLP